MPNWCFNSLEVSGNADAVERFVTANMGLPAQYPKKYNTNGICINDCPPATEKHFCFNALVPTPQEVLDIGFDGHDVIPREDLMGVYKGIIPPVLDGYHWNVVNWGTKWDIYREDLTAEVIGWTKGCEKIYFEFETAWSPPIDWLIKVVEMFPELHFKFHYEESGCYFAGDIYGEGGSCTIDEYDDARCNALFQYWEDGEDDEQVGA